LPKDFFDNKKRPTEEIPPAKITSLCLNLECHTCEISPFVEMEYVIEPTKAPLQ